MPSWKVMAGVGVGVGVAIVTVGGAMYINKSQGNRKSRSEVNTSTSQQTAIEMSIPSESAGLVIGRGGENVKNIQRRTNTRIHFKDEGKRAHFMRYLLSLSNKSFTVFLLFSFNG